MRRNSRSQTVAQVERRAIPRPTNRICQATAASGRLRGKSMLVVRPFPVIQHGVQGSQVGGGRQPRKNNGARTTGPGVLPQHAGLAGPNSRSGLRRKSFRVVASTSSDGAPPSRGPVRLHRPLVHRPETKKGGAPRLPPSIYIPDRGLPQGVRAFLESPPCRSGRRREKPDDAR